jgi:hypothetical protein
MNSVKLILVLGLVTAAQAAPAGYCSLVVSVTDPNGKRPTAIITVIEQGGRTIDGFSEGRDVRFCDLGLLPVTVKVGADDSCNQVTVNNVPMSWLQTYHLKITYDLRPCLEDKPRVPSPFCTYLFRISDSTGKWVTDASVHVEPINLTLKSDDSGRVSVDMKLGSVAATIDAPGYATQSFASMCTLAKAYEPQEALIKLVGK